MKHWLLTALLLPGLTCAGAAAWAQESAQPPLETSKVMSPKFVASASRGAMLSVTSRATSNVKPLLAFDGARRFRALESAVPASPLPAAETRSRPGGYDNSWEMGLGYAFVKFRSSPIQASMNGLNSSVAYYPSDHFAIEANATTAFGSPIFDREHTKFLFYGAGVKYVHRRGETWEPWAHVLAGGVHMLPQTAAGGQNALALKFGGGVDYQWSSDRRWALRIEGDFVRSQLYSQGQNNFMFATGFVIR